MPELSSHRNQSVDYLQNLMSVGGVCKRIRVYTYDTYVLYVCLQLVNVHISITITQDSLYVNNLSHDQVGVQPGFNLDQPSSITMFRVSITGRGSILGCMNKINNRGQLNARLCWSIRSVTKLLLNIKGVFHQKWETWDNITANILTIGNKLYRKK